METNLNSETNLDRIRGVDFPEIGSRYICHEDGRRKAQYDKPLAAIDDVLEAGDDEDDEEEDEENEEGTIG